MTLTLADLPLLLPFIIIGYGGVMVMVVGAFWRSHFGMALLSVISLAAAFLTIFVALPSAPRQVTPLLLVDTGALFYLGLFCLGGIAIALFAHDYMLIRRGAERFYSLLLFAVFGMAVLAASSHFASFFAGLEVLSVSLFGLIGYAILRPNSLEGSLKYLVLAGVSLSFLLFGMAMLYFEFGTMEFASLAAKIQQSGLSPIVLFGAGLMLVGFSFKLALVPFHTWAPDVYQGAPAPISALVATGSKAALLVLLLRFLAVVGLREHSTLFLALEILAIITMFSGNLLALLQGNVKRLLAYSSVAHIGYLLIPLLAGGVSGVSSIGFYLVSYFATTIGAFGVVSVLSSQGEEWEKLEDYRGLGLRRPWLGAALALMMLSLAGIPPGIGFMAKFYIFSAAARSELWLLLIVGVLNSGLSAYYYLRVLVALYQSPAAEEPTWARTQTASAVCLVVLSAVVIIFGCYPSPLISLTQRVAHLWFLGR